MAECTIIVIGAIQLTFTLKPYKFENNRRIRSKMPSANLQVTSSPASCSLALQNPSQLQRLFLLEQCEKVNYKFLLVSMLAAFVQHFLPALDTHFPFL